MIGTFAPCNAVLVVEDDPDILLTLQELLQQEGYQVLTAINGLEALNALATIDRPVLILLDLFMPVMDGWQFLKALPNLHNAFVTASPILIISASGEKAAEAAKGVQGLIKKPIDLDELLLMVEKFCPLRSAA